MIVYKIVRNEGGRYFSMAARGAFRLEYAVGKVTVPEEGEIFAFRTKKNALKYCSWFSDCAVLLRCETDGYRELEDDRILAICEYTGKNTLRNFWRYGPEGFRWTQPTPEGTVLCLSVTPIEVVPRRGEADGY